MRVSSGKRPATWGAPCTITYRPTWSLPLARPCGKRRLIEFKSNRGVSIE